MFLSTCRDKGGTRTDVTAKHISRALKLATTELQYPTNKGIPITRINTHSLCSGGSNALALAGYSDTNPENELLARGNLQGVHSGGTGVLRPQHVAVTLVFIVLYIIW
jgi:hypothetical protein